MSEKRGYIYRVARANRQYIEALVRELVGAGWEFSGAAQWDFDLNEPRSNLRPIKPFADASLVGLEGDFGHIFSKMAEIRWKRRNDGEYDVLIFSEDRKLMLDDAWPLVVDAAESDWHIQRYADAAIVQSDGQPAIEYIEYLAPNGAVQFQRLVEVKR